VKASSAKRWFMSLKTVFKIREFCCIVTILEYCHGCAESLVKRCKKKILMTPKKMTTVTGKVSTRLGDFARGDRRSPGMIISLPGTGIAMIRNLKPARFKSFSKSHESYVCTSHWYRIFLNY